MLKQAMLILLLSGFILLLPAAINRIEYFWDTDPGYGNGTPLSFSGGDDATVSANISAANLSGGLHVLYTRARDNTGKWSQTGHRLLFKSGTDPANITRLEYYFDADPGYGNGTALSFSPGSQVVYLDAIGTAGLPYGMHTLNIRARNTLGYWSQNAARNFVKIPSTVPNLNSVICYFDGNEAIGQTLAPIPLNGDPTATELTFNLDPAVMGVAPGMHMLNVVAVNSAGLKSQVMSRLFYYQSAEIENLTRVEWYFIGSGADPNQVFAHQFSSPAEDVSAPVVASITHLQQDGVYEMHLWTVDALGRKSLEQIYPFTVNFTPLNLAFTINGSQITLSWDEILGSAYYKVLVKNAPTETGTLHIETDTDYTEAVGNEKFYEVRAVSGAR